MREIVKAAKAQGSESAKVVSRVLDPNAVDGCDEQVATLADEIDAILRMEKEERSMGEAERDVRRGENLVDFSDEIASRPRRTWFAGERDKQQARERGARELNGADAGGGTGKRNGSGKMSGKEKKRLDDWKLRKGSSGGAREGEGAQGKMWKKPKNKSSGKNGPKAGGKKGKGAKGSTAGSGNKKLKSRTKSAGKGKG